MRAEGTVLFQGDPAVCAMHLFFLAGRSIYVSGQTRASWFRSIESEEIAIARNEVTAVKFEGDAPQAEGDA